MKSPRMIFGRATMALALLLGAALAPLVLLPSAARTDSSQNARYFLPLAADPTALREAQVYGNTTSHVPKYYNGSTWKTFAFTDSVIACSGCSTNRHVKYDGTNLVNSLLSDDGTTVSAPNLKITGTDTSSTTEAFFIQNSALTRIFAVANNGAVGVGTIAAPAGALEIVSASNPLFLSVYGTGAIGIVGRRARGTQSVPTAVVANDFLNYLSGRGYHSGGAFATSANGLFGIYAAEAFTATAQGTYLTFETSATGTTTRAERFRVTATGLFTAGGESGSSPAWKRNSTGWQARLSNDSDYTTVDAGNYLQNGTVVTIGTTFSTGNAAGAANAASTTAFLPFGFLGTNSTAFSATESLKQTLITHACTLKNLYIVTTGAQDGSGSQVFTVRVNGVDTGITITLGAAAAAGTNSDTTHTASAAAGSLISLKSVNNATLNGATVTQWAIDCQ